ncbi:MAG: GxxExxY protein [Syntrophorhabdales bacterium]|jgi:hypothetical protein
MTEAELNQLSSQIIKAAINVHTELGPGLLESVYNACMVIELTDLGLDVKVKFPCLSFIGVALSQRMVNTSRSDHAIIPLSFVFPLRLCGLERAKRVGVR